MNELLEKFIKNKIIKLYKEMYKHTKNECAHNCRIPHSCCNYDACIMTKNWAKEYWNIELEITNNNKIPYMSDKGCIIEPHLRPNCTFHTCSISSLGFKEGDNEWTDTYFNIRNKITDLEYILFIKKEGNNEMTNIEQDEQKYSDDNIKFIPKEYKKDYIEKHIKDNYIILYNNQIFGEIYKYNNDNIYNILIDNEAKEFIFKFIKEQLFNDKSKKISFKLLVSNRNNLEPYYELILYDVNIDDIEIVDITEDEDNINKESNND